MRCGNHVGLQSWKAEGLTGLVVGCSVAALALGGDDPADGALCKMVTPGQLTDIVAGITLIDLSADAGGIFGDVRRNAAP